MSADHSRCAQRSAVHQKCGLTCTMCASVTRSTAPASGLLIAGAARSDSGAQKKGGHDHHAGEAGTCTTRKLPEAVWHCLLLGCPSSAWAGRLSHSDPQERNPCAPHGPGAAVTSKFVAVCLKPCRHKMRSRRRPCPRCCGTAPSCCVLGAILLGTTPPPPRPLAFRLLHRVQDKLASAEGVLLQLSHTSTSWRHVLRGGRQVGPRIRWPTSFLATRTHMRHREGRKWASTLNLQALFS